VLLRWHDDDVDKVEAAYTALAAAAAAAAVSVG
jgi:hypothetical protein